jgi:hypothetical protein
MTVLSIHGPVARLDTLSADGRLLLADGLIHPTATKPLLALHAGINPGLGHYGAEPAGVLSAFDVTDGVLEVVGEVYDDQRVPAGSYACGLDVEIHESEDRSGDGTDFPDGVLVAVRWSVLAVTLHLPGSTGRNAWPDLPPLVAEVVAR